MRNGGKVVGIGDFLGVRDLGRWSLKGGETLALGHAKHGGIASPANF